MVPLLLTCIYCVFTMCLYFKLSAYLSYLPHENVLLTPILSWILVHVLCLRECQPAFHMSNYISHESPPWHTHKQAQITRRTPKPALTRIVFYFLRGFGGHLTHISPLCPAALRVVFLWGGKTKQQTKAQTFYGSTTFFPKIFLGLRGVFRPITIVTSYYV